MKTVGEFKKAGLVFVNGDVYCHKGSTLKMLADGITLKWFGRDVKALNATIIGFAWRENTGVKPEFKGVIEFTFNGEGCEMQDVRLAENVNWEIVKKWRPSLNQPSVAEYDTKESAIHKAWVDLKGDLSNTEKHDRGGKFLVVCIKDGISIKKGEYQIASHKTNNTEYWENVCTIQEFTDYCEKMAAEEKSIKHLSEQIKDINGRQLEINRKFKELAEEEKRMDIIGQNGNDGLHYDNTAQQVESLAVNDKPTFTQAMADAGELPPVGSKVLFDGDSCFEFRSEYEQGLVDGGVVEIISHFDSGAGNVAAFLFDCNDGRSVSYGNNTCFKPIDTRTDREKAINEMASLISLRTRDGAKEVCGELYDAGYRKC